MFCGGLAEASLRHDRSGFLSALSFLRTVFVSVLRVDGDFDLDCAAIDFLVLQLSQSLLLFFLILELNEAVTLALPRVTPAPPDDVSRVDLEASIGEDRSETSVVQIEG